MKARRIAVLLTTALALYICAEKAKVPQREDKTTPATVQERLLEEECADEWTLADFSDCFGGEWETIRDEIALGEHLSVTVLGGKEEGPVVYAVAGIHGDEVAGWRAGNLLKTACLRAGTLYIISPANEYGAAHNQRKTEEERDLNRNFPGDADGCDAARIAAVIFDDIEKRQPELLLDLHEARESAGGNADALGNSIICDARGEAGELVWDMLLDSERGRLCSSPLTLYGSPPRGSINRTVSEQLGVPSITVETLRTEPLAQRVRNQLEIVQYVLRYKNMI